MKIRSYKARTKWIEGTKLETEIREFKVSIDEPLELRGTNGCILLTYRGYARKFNIDIKDLAIDLEGEMVTGGWIDEEGKERRGYKEVRYKIKIKTEAPDEEVRKLHKLVEEKCPVFDMLINPTKVKGIVIIN